MQWAKYRFKKNNTITPSSWIDDGYRITTTTVSDKIDVPIVWVCLRAERIVSASLAVELVVGVAR